ncbi:hypothetical protein BDZ89DRAFT_182253 [Hymenopellis radicata]|nr:hypothetical protein BDZ89DRAFT_182253 [Hymenopellis radicata]
MDFEADIHKTISSSSNDSSNAPTYATHIPVSVGIHPWHGFLCSDIFEFLHITISSIQSCIQNTASTSDTKRRKLTVITGIERCLVAFLCPGILVLLFEHFLTQHIVLVSFHQ